MLTSQQREARKQGIGASECAAALGISSFMTPYELWLIKTGREPEPDLSDNQHVLWGTLLEPVIADYYAKTTGEILDKVDDTFIHPTLPFMLCHPDRLIHGKRKLLQIKTANPFTKNWGDAGSDEVPLMYLCQVQHEMACTGYDETDLIVFRGTTDVRTYPIKRDQKVIDYIEKQLSHFWNHHVLGDNPPPAKTRNDLKHMFPLNNGDYAEYDPAIEQHLLARKKAKEIIDSAENDKADAEFEIIKFIGDKDGIICDDDIIATYKADKNGKRTLRVRG